MVNKGLQTGAFHPTNGPWSLPVGVMMQYAGLLAPLGWLLCDGSAVSRKQYAALYNTIGTTYGAGNGNNTFNLPDMRGKVAVGAGQGAGLTNRIIAASGGEENHPLSSGELATHSHSVTDPGHGHGVDSPADFGLRISISKSTSLRYLSTTVSDSPATFTALDNNTTGISTQNTGSGTAHNTMQPFLVVNHIIKI